MTYDIARNRIILYSLILTGGLLPFFFISPVLGYPLSPDQARQAISLLLPVFLGYLGSGVVFIFNNPYHQLPEPTETNKGMLALLINGAFIVFLVSFLALLFAFGYSNRQDALPGVGIDYPTFSSGITAILSIMTTVVGGSVIHLFGVQSKDLNVEHKQI